MIERKNTVELVPGTEVVHQRPKTRAGKNRACVRDAARFRKPGRPGRIDINEVIFGSNPRLGVGRGRRVGEKARIGVVVEDENPIERFADLLAFAKAGLERMAHEDDLGFGDFNGMRQWAAAQIGVEQGRSRADAGDAQHRGDIERRVLGKKRYDVPRFDARGCKHVCDPRGRVRELRPGEVLVLHFVREVMRRILGVLQRNLKEAIDLPQVRAEQPRHRAP